MNVVEVRLQTEHELALKKVQFEKVMAKSNLVFLFNQHLADADGSFLGSNLWLDNLYKFQVKSLNKDAVERGLLELITGEHNSLVNYFYSPSTKAITLYSNDVIGVSPDYVQPATVETRFLSFTDFIAQIYPEQIDQDLKGADRVLTRTVTLQVTDACNLCCTYCYQINKGLRKVSLEDAKLFIDKLLTGEDGFDKYVSPKVSPGIILDFIGGEPLLEIKLIDQVVDYFRSRCIEMNHPWADKYCISLCSNGVLYTDSDVQQFLQKNHDCISLSVTLDGNKELHDACRVFADGSGSYDLAEFATQDWMKRGYYMGSKITISPDNLEYIYDALIHIVGLGYTEINANCIYEAEWTNEQAEKLYHLMKRFADFMLSDDKYETLSCSLFVDSIGIPKTEEDTDNWCGGTGVMLSMDPDGWLYPCIRYMESSLGTDQIPMRIGHVKTGLATCQEDKECIGCLQRITRKTQSTDECFYCPIAEGCSWCSAFNYQVFGTADRRVTRICPMHKGRVLANAYYWNNYYRKYGIDKHFDMWVPRQWAETIVGHDEYEELIKLVKEMGGFINESDTEIHGYKKPD